MDKIDQIAFNVYEDVIRDPQHRYRSWEHCYNAFSTSHDINYLSLQLAFYLASWGMYRGSSGLLQKDYTIHMDAVKIIKSKTYDCLKCSELNEVTTKNSFLILELKSTLKNYYESCQFIHKDKGFIPISATDTLISKVMLGTLGCVPAYDRFVIEGFKVKGVKGLSFTNTSLDSLFRFIDNNKVKIEEVQQKILNKGTYYPTMKIIDMYFFAIGSHV